METGTDSLLALTGEKLNAAAGAVAVVDLDVFDANAAAMVTQAQPLPLRVASKSVRCRALLRRAVDNGFGVGVLAYTLGEALWLCGDGFRDVVVAYPTVDVDALRELGVSEYRAEITLMVDCVEHLELIERCVTGEQAVRVCIDTDAAWRPFGNATVSLGAKRSPIRTVEQAIALARAVVSRPQLKLVGLMSYDAQIAGVGDQRRGKPFYGRVIKWMHGRSARELLHRRRAIADGVRAISELEFVNGGGTGSLSLMAHDATLTELAAGSGLFAPTLFDTYSRVSLAPAFHFALPVVRKPNATTATVFGGGYIASGTPGQDRMPTPVFPRGLKLDRNEGAGEVQTPVVGEPARGLSVGDNVWFRPAKAGEVCEHFNELYLVRGGEIVEVVPTYRGEGMQL